MKTKYSTSRTLTLLLGSALFFTSCTKEDLQVPQQVNPENQAHAVSASNASQPVLKTTNRWFDCGGSFITNSGMVVVFTANFKVEDKSDELGLELYAGTSDGSSVNLLDMTRSSTGTATLTWLTKPGVVYYIRSTFPMLPVQWMRKMDLSLPYWVSFPSKIPGNSKAASVIITPV